MAETTFDKMKNISLHKYMQTKDDYWKNYNLRVYLWVVYGEDEDEEFKLKKSINFPQAIIF